MIGLYENDAPVAQFTKRALGRPWPERRVRVMSARVGEQDVLLFADGACRLLAVGARRLTPELDYWLREADFGGRASQCGTLQTCLRMGYVMAGHEAAQWMCRDAALLVDLRRRIIEHLTKEAA
jgi:hypothetical protein